MLLDRTSYCLPLLAALVPQLCLACSHLPGAADCNGNGVADAEDVADGTSRDCNDNGIPDECDPRHDFDGDGDVDLSDFGSHQICFTVSCANAPCESPLYGDPCCAISDHDGDGDVDLSDFLAFHIALTGGAPFRVHGLDFGPFVADQDPSQGATISEEQLIARMQIIVHYTHWIRTFGCSNGLEHAGRIAHDMGLKAAVGAWISDDLNANEDEIANLIAVAQAGHADMVIVGSEVLLRHELTAEQLIAYINQVRAAIPLGIPVTTADGFGEFLEHPEVVSAVDAVLPNYYPYWHGIAIDRAVAAIDCWHQQVVEAAGGKPVIVSETGWPSCGEQIGDAIPSPENASLYFLNFVSWARAANVEYLYFEAFDEPWKAAYEGPQGACWGVWDKDGYLKPDMQPVFAGRTMPDNWSTPGGPGDPDIEFVHVPSYGSFDDLTGNIWHVEPLDHRVLVYIYVEGGWWTKPYWNEPFTGISCHGGWVCDITTGGNDQFATRIAAFLVPSDSPPFLRSGEPSLPGELEATALDSIEVTRSP